MCGINIFLKELVSPSSLAFEVQTCKFYHERIPRAAKMKRIPTLKLHEGGRGLRIILRKRGLVVNFEHKTSSCIRPIASL